MRLYFITLNAKARAVETENHNRAWLAWHTALIPRMKETPSLADLTGIRPQIKKMTPAEMKAAWAPMREIA